MTDVRDLTAATGVPALGDDEAAALLASVHEFRTRAVDPLTDPPERDIELDELVEVAVEAAQLGLLPDDEAVGLWDEPSDTARLRFSLDALAILAASSAGAALHLHQLALGALVLRRLGAAETGPHTVPALQGRSGLARGSLARLLAAAPLDERDRAALFEHLAGQDTGGAPITVQAADGWEALVVPRFDGATLRWERYPRERIRVEPQPAGHGLDGTATWSVELAGAGEPLGPPEADAAIDVLREALRLNTLGLLALGHGVAHTARVRSSRYARERHQGGAPIVHHPAVALHLGRISSVVSLTVAALAAQRGEPPTLSPLVTAFGLRAALHPMLCEAVSGALQVLGGYGYMRDHGLERLLRDSQHLKLSFGTPTELRLFVAAAEEGDP